jgi:hypothetical protein
MINFMGKFKFNINLLRNTVLRGLLKTTIIKRPNEFFKVFNPH